MVKFISKIIGAKIILFQERAIIGMVKRVLIDPSDGAFVGLAVNALHNNKEMYIPLTEIKGFGQGLIIIEELSSLSDSEEVIKIKEVLESEPKIANSLVVTENGQKLGRVEDATLDLRIAQLKKIYVNPRYLKGILGDQLIIDAKQIVAIEQERIIVKDGFAKEKKPVVLPAQLPIVE